MLDSANKIEIERKVRLSPYFLCGFDDKGIPCFARTLSNVYAFFGKVEGDIFVVCLSPIRRYIRKVTENEESMIRAIDPKKKYQRDLAHIFGEPKKRKKRKFSGETFPNFSKMKSESVESET